jgi:hypothetical protein
MPLARITIIAMISHLLRLRISGKPPGAWYRNTLVGMFFVFIMRISTVPFSGFIHFEIIIFRNEPGKNDYFINNSWNPYPSPSGIPIAGYQAGKHEPLMNSSCIR